MQRLLGLAAEIAIDGDEVARTGSLAGNNNLIVAEAGFERELRGLQGGEDHALIDDVFGFFAEIFVGVFLHFGHDELLIQRAAVDADADRLSIVHSDFADSRKLFVATLACADVAGIDAVFVERFGAVWIFCEKNVAVVMEVSNDGDVAARGEKTFFDFGNRGGGFGDVDSPANDFGAGFGEIESLLERGFNVGGVRVGHGLDDDRSAAADLDVADFYAIGLVARMTRAGGVEACDLSERSHPLQFNKFAAARLQSAAKTVRKLMRIIGGVEVAERVFDEAVGAKFPFFAATDADFFAGAAGAGVGAF